MHSPPLSHTCSSPIYNVSLSLIHREKVDSVNIFRLSSLCWELSSDILKVTEWLEPEQEFKFRAILKVYTFSDYSVAGLGLTAPKSSIFVESAIDCE